MFGSERLKYWIKLETIKKNLLKCRRNTWCFGNIFLLKKIKLKLNLNKINLFIPTLNHNLGTFLEIGGICGVLEIFSLKLLMKYHCFKIQLCGNKISNVSIMVSQNIFLMTLKKKFLWPLINYSLS